MNEDKWTKLWSDPYDDRGPRPRKRKEEAILSFSFVTSRTSGKQVF
jgi:hypothetical protein